MPRGNPDVTAAFQDLDGIFLKRLMNTRFICSRRAEGPEGPGNVLREPDLLVGGGIQLDHAVDHRLKPLGNGIGPGMRANSANSSRSPFSPSTCWMMVRLDSSNTRSKSGAFSIYFFLSRSAES